MKINRITAGVHVRNDYQKCFKFYTEKLGLVPIYGDGNGPYTSFASHKDEEPFFAIYEAAFASEKVKEYVIPNNTEPSDTLTAVFHTTDFEAEYNRMLKAGVQFIGKNNFASDGFDFNLAYFRDPEGNLLSLEDGDV